MRIQKQYVIVKGHDALNYIVNAIIEVKDVEKIVNVPIVNHQN